MTRTAPPSHGFTLIEVLVSVSLLALLLLVGYGAMRTATQSARGGESLIARTEELRTAQAFLRRQLAGMLSLPYETDPRTGMAYRFEGGAESIRFVAPMPGYLSRGGAHVQQLNVVPGRDGLRLEFRHDQLNGYDPQEPIGGDREPVVLMDRIDEALFEFRRREPNGELGDWVGQWDDPQLLPVQIRLRIGFADGDLRRWPDIEVPVMAAATPVFGAVSGPLPPGRRPPGTTVPKPDQ